MSRPAGFVLDLHRCVGCGACVLACRIENQLPPETSWRRILPLNLARYPGGATYFFSLACHHCQDPPCAKGCPSGALKKRADGVVLLRSELCLGCRYCEMACPFGAPVYDERSGLMTKCHLCYHRLDQDRLPACVEACPTEALRFGIEKDAGGELVSPAADVPGFVDPGGARPGLALEPPGRGMRAQRFRTLLEALGVQESGSAVGGAGGAGGARGEPDNGGEES